MTKKISTLVKNANTQKTIKIMRLITLFLVIGMSMTYASNSYAQITTLSLDVNNKTVREVFNEIENSSEYVFLYNRATLDANRVVSISAEKETIIEILDKLFADTDNIYKVSDRQVYISKAEKHLEDVDKRTETQQKKTITGIVLDQHGESIIGANVVEVGTANGTVTDIDGRFTLQVEDNAVIQITYIGYLEQNIDTRNRIRFDVVLLEDTKVLDEVVAIGYGVQRKMDLTGSVANVTSDKLNTQSNINIGAALQGKIAGVDIVSQGGSPGAGSRIMIRGIGTLNNANPLYIVDGMYMDNMDHINPNDIESIDVLKDASSSAIYGSRAANGVVIITTKAGSNTEGVPQVDVSLNFGLQTPNKYLNMLNAEEWAEVTTVARAAIGSPILDMAQDLSNKPDNDWQRIMLGSALMQNYNVSLSGGSKAYTYYTSLGYMNQEGVVKGTNYERYTLQFKSDYKKGILSIGNNIVLTNSNDSPHPAESRGGLLGSILQSVPTLDKYDESRVGGYGGSYGDVVNLNHPLGVMDSDLHERYNENIRAYINLYAELELLSGLKYKFNLTPDYHFNRYTTYEGIYDWGLRTNDLTSLAENRGRWNNMLVENTLSYVKNFNNGHNVSLLGGYSYQDNKYRYMTARGKGLPDGIKEIDAATIERVTGGNSSRNVLTSVFARAFYSYKNRYLFTATIRRDGSSKFAKSNRYGNFPSFSIGWNVAEENFMSEVDWLDQLKIRGGYGVLGNQEIGNYQFASTITTGINYPDGYGGLLQGAFPKIFSSPNIKWEETAMTNIGLDFVSFNNRLTLTTDYYIKRTSDILLTVPIPISSGGANDPIRNAGEIVNKGLEFTLGWNDRLDNGISYSVDFLGNFISNEVEKMGTGSQEIWGGATNQNINTSKTVAGYPIGGYWLIPVDGFFHSEAEVAEHSKDGKLIQETAKPGDIRFKDVNGDGVINDDDRVYSGSPFPNFTASLNGTIAYKNFDLMIGLQGVFGNKIYNATRQTLEDVTKGTNFLKEVYDYWTPENPNASHPRLAWDDPNRNTRAESNRYLEDGSFVRLRSLQLGYSVPKNILGQHLENTRVYFNAENLFTITKYSGYSPDVNTSSATARGFDNFIYPTNRVLMIGMNLTF